MFISNFISTCLSHRAFKLKSQMDSRLSPLCFLPPGLSISEGSTTIPPVIQAPRFRIILDFFFPLLSDPKCIPLGSPVGSASKSCPYLDSSHSPLPATPLSCRCIPPGPPECPPSSLLFPTIHSSPSSWSDPSLLNTLVKLPKLFICRLKFKA